MSTSTTEGLGAFVVLPRELRDQIYQPLIHANQLNILTTSKAICKEVSTVLLQDGICRMNFGYCSDKPAFFPTQALADKLQIINATIGNGQCLPSLGGGFPTGESMKNSDRLIESDRSNIEEHLAKFGGGEVKRKPCMISFDIDSLKFQLFNKPVLKILRSFTGFRTVMLEVHVQADSYYTSASDHDISFPVDARDSWFQHGFKTVKTALEPTLGPGTEVPPEVRREVHCAPVVLQAPQLVFHPRQHVESLAKKAAVA